MKKLESTEIKSENENLLVSIDVEEAVKNGISTESNVATKIKTEFYKGTVENLGEEATNKENCPELQAGDTIMFNQFSGFAAATSDKFCKIIKGHDVVAISRTGNFTIEDTIPTCQRILVEILDENMTEENGLINERERDTRISQTQKGKIIRIGSEAKIKLPVNTIVFFDPYCGNLIVNEPNLKLKTLNYLDVLFSIK